MPLNSAAAAESRGKLHAENGRRGWRRKRRRKKEKEQEAPGEAPRRLVFFSVPGLITRRNTIAIRPAAAPRPWALRQLEPWPWWCACCSGCAWGVFTWKGRCCRGDVNGSRRWCTSCVCFQGFLLGCGMVIREIGERIFLKPVVRTWYASLGVVWFFLGCILESGRLIFIWSQRMRCWDWFNKLPEDIEASPLEILISLWWVFWKMVLLWSSFWQV